jgi:outer membrane protein TolC
MSLSFPIFLREARGNWAQTKLQLESAEYSLQDKRRTLVNKITAVSNAHEALRQQSVYAQQMVQGNNVLREGESKRFEVGESTLFLLNTREQALIKASMEYLTLKTYLPLIRVEYFCKLGGAHLLRFAE